MEENPYRTPQAPIPRPNPYRRTRMRARELFGVIVRAGGLYMIGAAIWNVGGVLFPPEGFTRMDYIRPAWPAFVAGLVFLGGADSLVGWAYRSSSADDDESSMD